MDTEQKERYVRWQNYRITQLSFSINLFLGFAVASLAYAINLKLTNISGIEQTALFYAIYWWSGSAVLGCVSTISRLIDFRYTARKIKDSSESDKCKAKFFGKITWGTFGVQVISYLIGGYQFVSNVALS